VAGRREAARCCTERSNTVKLALTILLTLTVAGTALASPSNRTLTIRHQVRGCHSWSFDGKNWKPTQSTSMVRGGVITIVDNDVMPHKLVQVSGPKARMTGVAMNRIGASARIAFPAKGRYVFTTRAGEDYMKGVETIGEDNVLRLVVVVS
jgi:hypothetical protein